MPPISSAPFLAAAADPQAPGRTRGRVLASNKPDPAPRAAPPGLFLARVPPRQPWPQGPCPALNASTAEGACAQARAPAHARLRVTIPGTVHAKAGLLTDVHAKAGLLTDTYRHLNYHTPP